ncbi:glycosyltransferase [Kocuria coralli]|uniref:glycosyltransferase n=1 Tax=Kocuria coralli TaxID=1461025 RepID=UPI0015F2DC92|nr:glycosyltransferase [Kocuria coralli]
MIASQQDKTPAPLVSLIVPRSEVGERLEQTVDELGAQTYPATEIVMVDDDARQPLPAQVLDRYAASGIAVIHEEGRGLAAALNAGIRRCTGELFMPIAGDVLEPPYVARAVIRMLADPQAGVVYGGSDTEGSPAEPGFSLKQQLLQNSVCLSALFRTDHWRRVGGFDERMRDEAAGHDYIMRLLDIGRSVYRLEGSYLHHRTGRPAVEGRAGIADRIPGTREQRRDWVSDHARIMRNNADFYVDHADLLWEQIFDLMDERDELRHRVAALGRSR